MAETKMNRSRAVLVSAVVAIAFIGFLLGVRPRPQDSAAAIRPGDADAVAERTTSSAPLARSNAELVESAWRASAAWVPSSALPAPRPDPALRGEAVERRAERRAFPGAPPTIPHPVAAHSSSVECRACHEHGVTIGDRTAPAMSHPVLAMCTQCHVPEQSGLPIHSESQAATIGSSFQPAPAETEAYRYTADSPPQTPHTSWMRQSCRSCHGPYGHSGLQTVHPERGACEQCHTSAAVSNQRGIAP